MWWGQWRRRLHLCETAWPLTASSDVDFTSWERYSDVRLIGRRGSLTKAIATYRCLILHRVEQSTDSLEYYNIRLAFAYPKTQRMGATVQVRGSWRNLFITLLWTYYLICLLRLNCSKYYDMLLLIDKSWPIEFDPQVLNSNLLQLDEYSNIAHHGCDLTKFYIPFTVHINIGDLVTGSGHWLLLLRKLTRD